MLIINRQATDKVPDITVKPAGDKLLRRIICTMLMLCVAVVFPHEGMAAAKKKQGNTPNHKYASIVVDAESGAIIFQSNANKPLHPASLTKVMTLLLLFEALESGSVRLNDKISISARAAAQQPSKIGLAAGSSIRVEDAILALVTKSANDISYAIGEHLAGSESRFAARMTKRAHDIGMSKTTFVNAHGLHHPRQISSARDMAILARYVIVRYPNYYRYFSTKQFTYRGKTYTNHNRLMNSYPGMDGFKTGFVNASGFNLIASAKRGDKRLIGVVFGGRTWKSRNDHMASLLNTGWGKARDLQYANAGTKTIAAMPEVKVAAATPPPVPVAKPVFKTTEGTLQVPPNAANPAQQNSFTSLSALDQGRKVIVPAGTTEQAVADVKNAIDRGDYSELTGEGDYDAINARRVETGLLAAAVYKGDHAKVSQIQSASAQATSDPTQQVLQQMAARQNPQILQAAVPPAPVQAASDLWSVQIGAYKSRVMTDDALRIAQTKLPMNLRHASPVAVPLKTSDGSTLFRARLGGLSKDQAMAACQYFRDCLPVAPR